MATSGLTGPVDTNGSLHPNALGHQAIESAIIGDLTPAVTLAVGARRGVAFAQVRRADRQVRNAGLTFAWDFDRLPGQGRFLADAYGARVAITGTDPDPRTPGRVATLRVTNALGLTTERAVFLPGRRRRA